MQPLDSVSIIIDVVKQKSHDGNIGEMRNAIAALASLPDEHARSYLFDLASRAEQPEVSDAATRAIAQLGPSTIAEWFRTPSRLRAHERWLALCKAASRGASVDVSKIGLASRLYHSLISRGRVDGRQFIAASQLVAGVLAGTAVATFALAPFQQNEFTDGSSLLLLLEIFVSAFMFALPFGAMFALIARSWDAAIGGWVFVVAEAAKPIVLTAIGVAVFGGVAALAGEQAIAIVDLGILFCCAAVLIGAVRAIEHRPQNHRSFTDPSFRSSVAPRRGGGDLRPHGGGIAGDRIWPS